MKIERAVSKQYVLFIHKYVVSLQMNFLTTILLPIVNDVVVLFVTSLYVLEKQMHII